MDFTTQKEYYAPPARPCLVDIEPMQFIMVDGVGEPAGEEYTASVEVLYGLAYTAKFAPKSGYTPEGYENFKVPPLEGLWRFGPAGMDGTDRQSWRWTSMLRVPGWVTPEAFEKIRQLAADKKPDVDFLAARLAWYEEGPCVQMMHKGPYSVEKETMQAISAFIFEHGLEDMSASEERPHHEIYLKDPRRTRPENLRTILRVPVER